MIIKPPLTDFAPKLIISGNCKIDPSNRFCTEIKFRGGRGWFGGRAAAATAGAADYVWGFGATVIGGRGGV